MWFLRLVCLEKPRLQMEHLKGQDPLCTYMCDLRSPGVGKDLEQRLHLCGFSCFKDAKKEREEIKEKGMKKRGSLAGKKYLSSQVSKSNQCEPLERKEMTTNFIAARK